MPKCYRCGNKWHYNKKETKFHKCYKCGNKFNTQTLKGKVFVYLIECGNGAIYTGITKNLYRRLTQHENGEGAKYTQKHGFRKLLGYKAFQSRRKAMWEEKRIKQLSHYKKKQIARKWNANKIYNI